MHRPNQLLLLTRSCCTQVDGKTPPEKTLGVFRGGWEQAAARCKDGGWKWTEEILEVSACWL